MSVESVRELIVGYRNKGLCSKRWKSVEAMVTSIEKEFYIKILPLKKEHMQTYARLEINEAQGHKDPSSSRPREFHPQPLSEPYVKVSLHTPLRIQIISFDVHRVHILLANDKTDWVLSELYRLTNNEQI